MFWKFYRYAIGTLLIAIFNVGSTLADELKLVEPLSSGAYSADASKGVVLLSVRWGRKPECGGFKNAQLRVIGFDKLPSQKKDDAQPPDLLLDGATPIMIQSTFASYAFLVDPGEYGLSGIQIKVARSDSDTEIVTTPRSALLKDGDSQGGTFKVGPGEIVYIGHFFLDCFEQPKLWRFFPESRNAFDKYLATYSVPEFTKAQYRLFKTNEYGRDFHLPE